MGSLFLALALLAAGAALALLLRTPHACGLVVSIAVTAASLAGLGPALRALGGGDELTMRLPWALPGSTLSLGLDSLSAFFLVPLLVLAPLAAIYGRAYLEGSGRERALAGHWAAFALLVATMVLVLLARDGLLFLIAWETMTLAAYILVTLDHGETEVRRAGWIFLVAAHAGTVALLALFPLLGHRSGSLDFAAASAGGVPGGASLLFLLALAGFGVKAGIVPLHVWLPPAHAAAPSHVSALLSAVMIKLGLYGILRVVLLLGAPAWWWGAALAALGLVGSLVSVTLALGQTDLKRSLAYSSVENVGLIAVGLGFGLWARARGDQQLATFALAGALLHIWNHALMKGLLFLGAGSVLHGAGSREMARLGGLLKRMPRTGLAVLVGTVAIAGLPPLNGFSGEWLLYLGLLRAGGEARDVGGLGPLFAVAALALVGALAALAFVRLAGIVLLGAPRSAAAASAHESPRAMTVPLLLLALACAISGLFPGQLALGIRSPLAALLGGAVAHVGPVQVALARLGALAAVLWTAMALLALGLHGLVRARSRTVAETWGCGYAAPSARMQYTGTSFAQLLAFRVAPRSLRPRQASRPPAGLFPTAGELTIATPDPFTRVFYEPFFRRWAERFVRVRWLQQGVLQLYLLYILAALVLALLWGMIGGGLS